jgi:hypothetical protein
VHLGRFGHRQIVLETSERSLLTVLLPAQQLRESIQRSFQTAVAELLTALLRMHARRDLALATMAKSH